MRFSWTDCRGSEASQHSYAARGRLLSCCRCTRSQSPRSGLPPPRPRRPNWSREVVSGRLQTSCQSQDPIGLGLSPRRSGCTPSTAECARHPRRSAAPATGAVRPSSRPPSAPRTRVACQSPDRKTHVPRTDDGAVPLLHEDVVAVREAVRARPVSDALLALLELL